MRLKTHVKEKSWLDVVANLKIAKYLTSPHRQLHKMDAKPINSSLAYFLLFSLE